MVTSKGISHTWSPPLPPTFLFSQKKKVFSNLNIKDRMITPPDSKNKLTIYKPYHLFLKEKKKSKHFFVGKGYFK